MAEEMNFIRGQLQMMSYQGPIPQHFAQNSQEQELVEEKLIDVSDGENDDDSDDELEDDEDDDDEEEDEDEGEGEGEGEGEETTVIELSHDPNGGIKVINFVELLNSTEKPEENDNNSEELGDLDELDEIEDNLDDDNDESEQNGSDNSQVKQLNTSDLEFIKSIDLSNLEESGEKSNVDYKKMSLNKLKEIAVAKGLIGENSKATKNAILKLLGSE